MTKKQPKKYRLDTALIVVLITAIATVFRLWGLKWGLPNSLHHYTYHPDEFFQIATMAVLNPAKLQLDPGFYNYPTGYMNLGSLILQVLQGYGMQMSVSNIYLAARVMSAIMGVATVPVVYFVGAKLYGRAAGIIAALVFAVLPLHIIHSHFATVDVPATLWVTVALLGASWIASGGSLKAYIATGLAAGLAVGTKYNVAIVILPVFAAVFLQSSASTWVKRAFNRQALIAFISFFAGFVIACPGFLIWPGKFLNGLHYEMTHAQSGHGLVFVGKGPGWFDLLSNAFGYGLGFFMLVMAIAAVGMAIARRKKSDWLLLAFVIPYFLLISCSNVRFARYAMPLLPPLAILIGRMMSELYRIAKECEWALRRWAWALVCISSVAYTLIYSAACVRSFSTPDVRDEAARWIMKQVPAGTTIGFASVPWFYTPPLSPETTGVQRQARFENMQKSRYKLLARADSEWDPTIVTQDKPAYIIVSDFEYQDPLRLKRADAMKFWSELHKKYSLSIVFKNKLEVDGLDFGPTERLPHDLKYQCPTIKVYRRR